MMAIHHALVATNPGCCPSGVEGVVLHPAAYKGPLKAGKGSVAGNLGSLSVGFAEGGRDPTPEIWRSPDCIPAP